MNNTITIAQVNGVSVVDSRLIAESIGIEHDTLMKNISDNKSTIESNFGVLRFEIGKPHTAKVSAGGRPVRYCLLTEDQSYFVLTLSRNSERVIEAKANLVKAFSRLRQEQAQPAIALPSYAEAFSSDRKTQSKLAQKLMEHGLECDRFSVACRH